MNCCDYECNDGPNCPIHGAKVAKVKQRYPKHPQPVPNSIWREYLRAAARFFLLGFLGWLIFGLILAALVVN